MRIPVVAALAALSLSACSESGVDDTQVAPEPVPSFDESPYRYCLARDDRWLRDQIDRVEASWPDGFDFGSLRYERMHTGSNWLDDVLDENSKELMVRYTATRSGEETKLFTLAEIDPETCALSRMEASIGWDRFEDRGKDGWQIP